MGRYHFANVSPSTAVVLFCKSTINWDIFIHTHIYSKRIRISDPQSFTEPAVSFTSLCTLMAEMEDLAQIKSLELIRGFTWLEESSSSKNNNRPAWQQTFPCPVCKVLLGKCGPRPRVKNSKRCITSHTTT